MGDRHKSTRVEAQTAARQVAALRLYIAGRTYAEIADTLEYADKAGAHKAVRAALDRLTSERRELAEQVLDIQAARYTDLYSRTIEALDDARDGREVGRAQLISAGRGILDSLSRLYGLDRNQATLTVRSESQIDRNIAELVAAFDREAEVRGIETRHELSAGGDGGEIDNG